MPSPAALQKQKDDLLVKIKAAEADIKKIRLQLRGIRKQAGVMIRTASEKKDQDKAAAILKKIKG